MVYYTLYLYPKAESERGDWIEEITRVRQLIEPETRSLTQSQAEVVLAISRTAFMQQLQTDAQFVQQQASAGGSGGSSDSSEVLGEVFSWKQMAGGEADYKQLAGNVKKFNAAYERQQNAYRQRLMDAFDESRANGDVLRYQLGRLRTETGSLDEVWVKAVQPLREMWQKLAESAVTPEVTDYEIADFKRRAEASPSYDLFTSKNPAELRYLKPQPATTPRLVEQPTRKLDAYLEQNLARELHAAYLKQDRSGK